MLTYCTRGKGIGIGIEIGIGIGIEIGIGIGIGIRMGIGIGQQSPMCAVAIKNIAIDDPKKIYAKH